MLEERMTWMPIEWARRVSPAEAQLQVQSRLRIAGLTLLAQYVDREFLYGNLHHRGGVGFFLLALLLMYGVLQLLRIGTRQHRDRAISPESADAKANVKL